MRNSQTEIRSQAVVDESGPSKGTTVDEVVETPDAGQDGEKDGSNEDVSETENEVRLGLSGLLINKQSFLHSVYAG